MTSFLDDEDDNVIAEITEPLKSEIIPVVEYIAVHNRLSVVFKDYLVRVYNESNENSFRKNIEDLEYSSLQIDADSIRILLK
jgi:hypothetical protein